MSLTSTVIAMLARRYRRKRIGLTLVLLLSVFRQATALGESKAVGPETKAEPNDNPTPSPSTVISPELRALSAWAEKNHAPLSVYVHDLEDDRHLSYNPSVPLNPASNMKVLTAIAALDELGAGYRFETGLYGALDGSAIPTLTLRGNGDPALSTRDLWALAKSLINLGVRTIDTLIVDQSRFDDQFVPPAFEQQPKEWAAFRAPISAIALEQNSVTLNVLPSAAGQPARVWFEPEGLVTVVGEVKTVKPGGGQDVRLTLQTDTTGLRAELSGSVSASLGRLRFDKRLDDPRLSPGLALRQILRDYGVTVNTVQLGHTQDRNRLVYHASAPLAELLTQLGKNSDNFYAEMIFKGLSTNQRAAAPGLRASSQESCIWLSAWLTRFTQPPVGTRCMNGSGLFDANRVASETLAQALTYAYNRPQLRAEVLAQFAVGGVDGTLRSRFRDARADFPVRAKTGTLRDTIALSGYVLRPGTRPPVVFSVLINGVQTNSGEARERIDQFVRSLQH